MRTILATLILLTTSACGQAPGAGGDCGSNPDVGPGWQQNDAGGGTPKTNGATLDLRADCTAAESSCGELTWSPPPDSHGNTTLIFKTTNAGCPKAGIHHCSATRSFYGKQEILSVACDQDGDSWYQVYSRGTP